MSVYILLNNKDDETIEGFIRFYFSQQLMSNVIKLQVFCLYCMLCDRVYLKMHVLSRHICKTIFLNQQTHKTQKSSVEKLFLQKYTVHLLILVSKINSSLNVKRKCLVGYAMSLSILTKFCFTLAKGERCKQLFAQFARNCCSKQADGE